MSKVFPIEYAKNSILEILKSNANLKGVEARSAYLSELVDLPLKKPLITITRGQILTKNLGFQDYVGKKITDGKIIETIGKELILKFEIDIWNNTSPKFGGEERIEEIKQILFELFEFYPKIIKNYNILEFKDGDTFEDPFEEGLFHSKCSIKLSTLWTKEFEYKILEEINTNSVIIE